MIRVSTSYLHMAVLIRGRKFDQRRDKQLLKRLYNTYSYIILIIPLFDKHVHLHEIDRVLS